MKHPRVNTLILATLVLGGYLAHGSQLESYLTNRQGLKELQKQQLMPAYKQFVKVLEDDPLSLAAQLNLALSLDLNEDFERAEKAYRGALELTPEGSKERFQALFNWAGVLVKLKKIPDALAAYQMALEIEPDSIEVKTNIELLWKGRGQGEGDANSDSSQEGKDQKQNNSSGGQQKQNTPPQQKQGPQKRPFESPNLSQEDVKKILDEIKNQEQSIRAQEYERNSKQAPRGKDW